MLTYYILTAILIFALFIYPIIKKVIKAKIERKKNKLIDKHYKEMVEKEKQEKKEK